MDTWPGLLGCPFPFWQPCDAGPHAEAQYALLEGRMQYGLEGPQQEGLVRAVAAGGPDLGGESIVPVAPFGWGHDESPLGIRPVVATDDVCQGGCFTCTSYRAKTTKTNPMLQTFDMSSDAGSCNSADLEESPWHLDSGANIVVVPSDDPYIVPGSINPNHCVPLHSTTDTILAPYALIDTPIGRLRGLAVPGAPRLVPTDHFKEFHELGRSLRTVHSLKGRAFAVTRGPSGTLVLDSRPVQEFGSRRAAARGSRQALFAGAGARTVKKDYWVEHTTEWVRHHEYPRRALFIPVGAPGGPNPDELTDERTTVARTVDCPQGASSFSLTDTWRGCSRIKCEPPAPAGAFRWIGCTHFPKVNTTVVGGCLDPFVATSATPELAEPLGIRPVEPDSPPTNRRLVFAAFMHAFNGQVNTKYLNHLKCGCPYCMKGKLRKPPRKKGTVEVTAELGKILVADLCTHLPSSYQGDTVMAVFRDLSSKLTWAFPIKSKQPIGILRAMEHVLSEIAAMREASGLSPHPLHWRLHTDGGGEFSATIIQDALTLAGGAWDPCAPEQHVASAESAIRSCVDQMRVNLEASGLNIRYWPDAVRQGTHNRRLDHAEYAAYYATQGSNVKQRAFGQLCFCAGIEGAQTKAGPRGTPCAYLCDSGRRGIKVVWLDPQGQYHTTVVEEGRQGTSDGVYWEPPDADGRPVMAFARAYQDLAPLCVVQQPGGVRSGPPGMTEGERDAWVVANPAEKGSISSDALANSNCPACRHLGLNGRSSKKAHRREMTSCIYGGLTQAQQFLVTAKLLGADRSGALSLSSDLKRTNVKTAEHKKGASGVSHCAKFTETNKYQEPVDTTALGGEQTAGSGWTPTVSLTSCPPAPPKPDWDPDVSPKNDEANLWKVTKWLPPSAFVAQTGPISCEGSAGEDAHAGLRSLIYTVVERAVSETLTRCWGTEDGHRLTLRGPTPLKAYLAATPADTSLDSQGSVPERDRATRLKDRLRKANTCFLASADQITHPEFVSPYTAAYADWQRHPLLQEHVSFLSMSLATEHDNRQQKNTAYFAKGLTPKAEAAHDKHYEAYVTREMTTAEKKGEKGMAAAKAEFDKLMGHNLCGPPVHRSSIQNPKAQMCGINMLSHIKHAEKPDAMQVMKGRCVLLGNALRYVVSDNEVGREGHWWELLASTPASLEESRVVDAYSVIHGFPCDALDFESAYLQAPWPTEKQSETYLFIPKHLRHFLTGDMCAPPGMDRPLWPLRRAGYGHPASGHLWARRLGDWLIADGWDAVGRPGKGCMFAKGNILIVVYVDDVKASGPRPELDEFWHRVSGPNGAFKWKDPPAEISEFLGASYERFHEDRDGEMMDVLHINLADYIRSTVSAYCEGTNKPCKPRKVSATKCIRRPTGSVPTTIPKQFHQMMIGRLLWIMRVCRPDIAEPVSSLGSRVACWSVECDHQLDYLVGYLLSTCETRLEFSWPVAKQGAGADHKIKSDQGVHVLSHIYSDSDWRGSDKSQSSFVCWVKPLDSAQGGCPIHWTSKKQSVTATSAADAEIVATHLAYKEGSWPIMMLNAACNKSETDFELSVDNNTAQGNMDKKPSDAAALKLKAFDTRAGFLNDMHLLKMFRAGHVPSDYNRSDAGTKTPKSVATMEWWRALLNLQLSRKSEISQRRLAWAATNGPVPSKEVLDGRTAVTEEDRAANAECMLDRGWYAAVDTQA